MTAESSMLWQCTEKDLFQKSDVIFFIQDIKYKLGHLLTIFSSFLIYRPEGEGQQEQDLQRKERNGDSSSR